MKNDFLVERLTMLQEWHAAIDKKIKIGYTEYLSDEHLTKMKQEKLLIKKQIVEIEHNLKGR